MSAEERILISAELTKRVMTHSKELVPTDDRMEFQLAPTQGRPGVILHFKANPKPWPTDLEKLIRSAVPALIEAAGPGLEAKERTGLWEGHLAWIVLPRAESKYLTQIGMSKEEIRAAVINLHRARISARLVDIFKQMPKKPAVSRSMISVDWPKIDVAREQQDGTIAS